MPPDRLAQVLGDRQRTPHPNLLAGFEGAEDAGVYRLDDERALVVTTDFFPPVVDDPFAFGQIAAANALSDVWAMGGRPLTALNIVGFPKALEPEVLGEILAGGADKVREAGAVIAGGHSIFDSEVKYGLAVTGEIHPDRILRNTGGQPGDVLILTKPLGAGLATTAIKKKQAEGPAIDEAIRWMSTLNGVGLDAILAAKVSALTDITGFGLLGHLREMLGDHHLAAQIEVDALPLLDGVAEFFDDALRTRGARDNHKMVAPDLTLPDGLDSWDHELLFDPQTSGGLLLAVAEAKADALVKQLRSEGLERAAIIGHLVASEGPKIHVQGRASATGS